MLTEAEWEQQRPTDAAQDELREKIRRLRNRVLQLVGLLAQLRAEERSIQADIVQTRLKNVSRMLAEALILWEFGVPVTDIREGTRVAG